MRLDVPRGLVIVGCVSVGFIISAGPGLVARAAEPAGWSHAIAADASAAAAQIRIAELEQRVRELEGHGGTGSAQASAELTAAMARNEELAARNHALSLENQELARARALVGHETGVLQHAEVLRDGGPADRQARCNVADGERPVP